MRAWPTLLSKLLAKKLLDDITGKFVSILIKPIVFYECFLKPRIISQMTSIYLAVLENF